MLINDTNNVYEEVQKKMHEDRKQRKLDRIEENETYSKLLEMQLRLLELQSDSIREEIQNLRTETEKLKTEVNTES